MKKIYHKSVLLERSIKELITDINGVYVDATFGGGGHSCEILNNLSPKAKLLAFDQDEEVIKNNLLKDTRFLLLNQNFRYIKNILNFLQIKKISGIIADLGVSSYQLDTAHRGFSTRFNSILDMRMNQKSKSLAKDILKIYTSESLSKMFYTYGNLKNSKKIASLIVKKRKKENILTTFDLIKTLKDIIPKKEKKFLARIFQSIRIEINDELSALKDLLTSSVTLLEKGGRIVVISYHSLEDRIVKNFFKNGNFDKLPKIDIYGKKYLPFQMNFKKVIKPSNEEILLNPRAKSARLRIAEKIF